MPMPQDVNARGCSTAEFFALPRTTPSLSRLRWTLPRAKAMPGVIVVHDGSFVGVAAPDEPTAARALAAIRVDWTTPSHLLPIANCSGRSRRLRPTRGPARRRRG